MADIQLRQKKHASHIVFEVLSEIREQFSLTVADWPASLQAFKQAYVYRLPEFELARLESAARHDIALALARAIEDQLVWCDQGREQTLSDYLQQTFEPLPLQTQSGGAACDSWQPEFHYADQSWSDFSALGQLLGERNFITEDAVRGLEWLSQHMIANGQVRLPDRKVAVLGGAAEMAPTLEFLKSGMEVLWIDKVAPPTEWQDLFSGTLHWAVNGGDLLSQPGEILATIEQFAAGSPIDICLYAYAPGEARELRLTGAMNAIVNRLNPAFIRSVTMLVSPTTPAAISDQDVAAMARRLANRPLWEGCLARLGLLGGGGGRVSDGKHSVARTLVSIQGASYQAAQYLGKVIMAEAWAHNGQIQNQESTPLRVSANTAAITRTRSLDHPVFDAAFGGAAALQVETLTPPQSRCLNGLLTLYDWCREDLPVPGAIRVHGGIQTLPYPLEVALRSAAAIGFVRNPALLGGFFRRG